jgi:Tfp pilus assembly protein PilF
MAMVLDARQGNLSRATEAAQREVERHPDDAARHLWLGELLALDSSADDQALERSRLAAERELKRAIELAPKDLRTWSALLAFYARTKQIDLARQLLKELGDGERVAGDLRAFVLARGYALLGDHERAKSLYLEAVKTNRDSVDVNLQASRYFLDTAPELAKQCVNRVLELEPNHHSAMQLAALLQFRDAGTEQELEQAFGLLDRAGGGDAPEVSDQRLKALLLLRRGGETSRRRALQILEGLVRAGSTPSDIDRLLLARLYETAGEIEAAGEQLRSLTSRDAPAAGHLAAYVNFLLRTNQASEATLALERLAKLEPENEMWRTVTLRARWLKALGNAPQVPDVVQAFLQRTLTKLQDSFQQSLLWLNAGELYSSLALDREAEAAYRQAVGLEPGNLPVLAMWLAQHGKASEAIQSCLAAANADATSQTARTLSSILHLAPISDELRTATEVVLARALERHPQDGQLVFDVATLRLFRGENDEALRLLRRALELEPNHVHAMNNLAILLSGQPQGHAEAIRYIDRAISLAGFDPELLDSKGWILLRHGDAAAAEALLRDAVSAPPGDSRHHFHLALAYHTLGRLDEARKSFQKATDGKLSVNLLTPEELSRLHSLQQALR